MKTPNPRGYAAQSSDATICTNVQMFDRRYRKIDPEPTLADKRVRPRKYFRALTASRLALTRPLRASAPPPATLTIAERKLFIPTGKRKVRKDGQLGAAEKIPVILVTAQLAIGTGATAFTFSASNRGQLVCDSRSKRRQPLTFVRQELHRMQIPDADSITNSIADILKPLA